MNKQKERFYHAQAAKLDLKRRWQSMAIWPIVYRHGERLKMEFEYQHGTFKVDLYIPAIKLAIEIDEPFHDARQEADAARQEQISINRGCEFVRIRVKDTQGLSLFQQIEELCQDIQRRIDLVNPPEWNISAKKVYPVNPSRAGGYSQAHLQALKDARIPERVEEMMKDLGALGIEVSLDMGPVTSSNGELGFSILMPGITFVVSVRANETAKLLVTDYSRSRPVLQKLGFTLDGPKKGKVDYWVINEIKGRFDIETVVEKLATIKQLLDS
jgi:very-short-patch-repair endonuclease